MPATESFYIWFFYDGVYRLGGWFIFMLLGLAAVIWLLYNSSSRRLPALGWRMSTIFSALLIVPAFLYRFTIRYDVTTMTAPDLTTSPLYNLIEPIFYLGILAGILPVILCVGYYVTYQGMLGCPRGIHRPFDAKLGQCPDCAAMDNPPVQVQMPIPQGVTEIGDVRPSSGGAGASYKPLVPTKRKVQAWLVTRDGKSYQLYENESTIGRMPVNDIYLTGDPTVGRQHAKILEQSGRFRLIDLGAKNFTRVNGHIVREPVILEPDDDIQFGDNTHVKFVSSTR